MKDRIYHRVIGKAGCLFPMKNIYLANFLIAAWTNCRNLLGMIRVVKRTETLMQKSDLGLYDILDLFF